MSRMLALLVVGVLGAVGAAPALAGHRERTDAVAGVSHPVCAPSSLRLDKVGGQGFTSHREWNFALRNVGTVTCKLAGFPGVAWVDAGAHTIAGSTDRHGSSHGTVTLAPFHRAFFNYVFVVAGPCIPHDFTAYGIQVIAPGTHHRLVWYAGSTQVCSPSLGGNPEVSAVSSHLTP